MTRPLASRLWLYWPVSILTPPLRRFLLFGRFAPHYYPLLPTFPLLYLSAGKIASGFPPVCEKSRGNPWRIWQNFPPVDGAFFCVFTENFSTFGVFPPSPAVSPAGAAAKARETRREKFQRFARNFPPGGRDFLPRKRQKRPARLSPAGRFSLNLPGYPAAPTGANLLTEGAHLLGGRRRSLPSRQTPG